MEYLRVIQLTNEELSRIKGGTSSYDGPYGGPWYEHPGGTKPTTWPDRGEEPPPPSTL